jgi:hypothetical protein
VEPVRFNFKDDMPDHWHSPIARIHPDLLAPAKKKLDHLLQHYLVPSDAPFTTALVIAPKHGPDGKPTGIRFCGAYDRTVNKYIVPTQHYIPCIEHELPKAQGWTVYVDADVAEAFHVIPIDEYTSQRLTIITPWGKYRPLYVPEGIPDGSGILQRNMDNVFHPCHEWMIVIFDNILFGADNFAQLLERLKVVLKLCQESGLTLKMKKSWFGFTEVDFFGFKISGGKINMHPSKLQKIQELPFPTNKNMAQKVNGVLQFSSRLIPNFHLYSPILTDMMRDNFNWDRQTLIHDYEGAFAKLKLEALNPLTLYLPDPKLNWIVTTDASDLGCGGTLVQQKPLPDGSIEDLPLSMYSHKWTSAASRYGIGKKEMCAIYLMVKAHEYLL